MKPFRFSSALALTLFGAFLLLAPAPAHAQKKGSKRNLVTAEDIAKYPHETLERIIARKVPGVDVVLAPGGGNMLRIRNATTLPDAQSGEMSDKPPLYVVDGVPIRTADGSVPPIDPLDLDSIRVLKGAETAAWGLEGSDGVILFTTKRGSSRTSGGFNQ